MASGQLNGVLRYLRRVSARTLGDRTDGQLLERFAAERDEAAFAALVRRHGPLVWGVCRRVLRHEHDAEDAFQATFLVLVRKADSIGKRASVGSWLYGVAYRVASRARAGSSRRRELHAEPPDRPDAGPLQELVWRDLRAVLDDEVSRLPERYRAPFVLCYLEGQTTADAAARLGCPQGTVLSRLARARDRLRGRLRRRGVALPAGLLLTAVAADAASAAMPAALADATTRTALVFAAGPTAAAGAITAPVAALTQGVLRTMMLTKLKIGAGVLLSLGVLGTGTGVLTHHRLLAQSPVGKEVLAQRPGAEERLAGDPAGGRTPAASDRAKDEEIARLKAEIAELKRKLEKLVSDQFVQQRRALEAEARALRDTARARQETAPQPGGLPGAQTRFTVPDALRREFDAAKIQMAQAEADAQAAAARLERAKAVLDQAKRRFAGLEERETQKKRAASEPADPAHKSEKEQLKEEMDRLKDALKRNKTAIDRGQIEKERLNRWGAKEVEQVPPGEMRTDSLRQEVGRLKQQFDQSQRELEALKRELDALKRAAQQAPRRE
jgi:RNA polymerase sigma factor (sigma-70 family)